MIVPGRVGKAQGTLALLGGGLALVGRLLAESSLAVEWHRTVVFPWLTPRLQSVVGRVDVRIGEVLVIALVGIALATLVRLRWRAFGGLILLAGVAVLTFYLAWGLAYRYPPLAGRLPPDAIASGTMDAKARLVVASEGVVRLLVQAAAAGPHPANRSDGWNTLRLALQEGFSRLPVFLEASPIPRDAFSSAKISGLSFALSRLQLSGYYFPWTGEALINGQMPASLWPRVAAHELAHQRGFARENEATVMGILACLASGEPGVFYSGALGLFISFDRDLAREDAAARHRLFGELPERALQDLRVEAQFWKEHEGVAGAVSEKVNDAYLKAQGIRDGVASYSETTRLFLQAIETREISLRDLILTPAPGARPE